VSPLLSIRALVAAYGLQWIQISLTSLEFRYLEPRVSTHLEVHYTRMRVPVGPGLELPEISREKKLRGPLSDWVTAATAHSLWPMARDLWPTTPFRAL
jgi:hypothetical protein